MVEKMALLPARLIELALIVLGGFIFLSTDPLNYVIAWDIAALLYLAIRIHWVRRARQGKEDAADWRRKLHWRYTGFIFTMLVSLAGLGAGFVLVFGYTFEDGTPDEETQATAVLFAVPAVLLAWAILHFGYAERYAHAYHAAQPERALEFPGMSEPTFVEFAYLAFCVGSTFATSDVEIRSAPMRSRVMAHSVLSFLYNAAILSLAISVLTGK